MTKEQWEEVGVVIDVSEYDNISYMTNDGGAYLLVKDGKFGLI